MYVGFGDRHRHHRARKRAQERLARIHEVTAAVAQAPTRSRSARSSWSPRGRAFSADGGGLADRRRGQRDGSGDRVHRRPGRGRRFVAHVLRSLRLPWNEVTRTGRPVVLTSPQDVAQYPDLAVRYRQTGMSVGAYIPSRRRDVFSGRSRSRSRARSFDQDDLALHAALGREGAVALDVLASTNGIGHRGDAPAPASARATPHRRRPPSAARHLAGGQGRRSAETGTTRSSFPTAASP